MPLFIYVDRFVSVIVGVAMSSYLSFTVKRLRPLSMTLFNSPSHLVATRDFG